MTATETPRALPGAAGARPLAGAAARLAALTGWRRAAMAMGLGAVATLSLPPLGLVPALLVAFPALLWMLDGIRTARGSFALGWAFGFGFFVISLYWISAALFTDIAAWWWMLPFAFTGLPAVMAAFPGGALAVLHRTRLVGLPRVVMLAALWATFEWLRGHVMTGFPWNLVGYAWTGIEPVLQATSVFGIYGLGLLTVGVAALPALLPDRAVPRRRAMAALAAGLGLFALIGGLGAWRLAAAPAAAVPGVRLRLVQPAIDQRIKWAPGERERNFERHLELSARPAEPAPTHVIWAETAVPFLIEQDVQRRQAVAALTPPGGLTITGAPRLTEDAEGTRRVWNGLVAIDRAGAVRGTYDKFHLVPFGEYMPLRRWIPIAPVAAGSLDFSAGPGPRTLDLPGLPPVSPLICYEVIFPGAVTEPGHRPAWLLNLTNDAWYGLTAGPHQHFAIARVRAVEEGLPMVRVANSGISGVVDPYGRITARLGLGEAGFVDAPLPAAASPTPYSRWGNWLFGVMLLLAGGSATLARRRR
ncbi:apolipoprotein N-acyltransferase [Arenibaculum pallidiluteum]|uniref:apolipoprotein N-acyltransferase n=1 Tax=Arenibaculum pallidiluteum TaxID=2812559 RepID=UPI002E29FCFA|nr:apolipoprotein N-acyltransferase [Arenibaculum pallidiluteum]